LKEKEIIQIFTKIIGYITNPKTIGKDIYVSCIKAILKESPSSSCYTVGKVIVPELVAGISSNNNEIKELCFDALNDYVNTYNFILIKESESVIKHKDSIFKEALASISIGNESLSIGRSNYKD
jgi:hypothetical protein